MTDLGDASTAGPGAPSAGRATDPGTLLLFALFEATTGAGAWSTRLRTSAHAQAVRFGRLRRGRSRRHVVLRALGPALDEAARLGWADVTLVLDDPRGGRWLRRFLEGGADSRDPAAPRVRAVAARFRRLTVRTVPDLDDPALVRTAKLALDSMLARAGRAVRHRRSAIETVLARARSVTLTTTPEGVRANGRYRVSLDPPSCDCPGWRRRWARVPLAGRRAARLPCKHLAALAIREGIGTPSDLERLVRRARE